MNSEDQSPEGTQNRLSRCRLGRRMLEQNRLTCKYFSSPCFLSNTTVVSCSLFEKGSLEIKLEK